MKVQGITDCRVSFNMLDGRTKKKTAIPLVKGFAVFSILHGGAYSIEQHIIFQMNMFKSIFFKLF